MSTSNSLGGRSSVNASSGNVQRCREDKDHCADLLNVIVLSNNEMNVNDWNGCERKPS
ncbi:hypothetical protein L798_03688 [Zootermopsis nevadensis]|uniref:Uncharacterized protein n=1 Tax=Zootermopsis nevadensis TaxID=136037 RepID=A0A067RKG4_ZOONE|nr:hypothetical protein L798_03688 [Zootermopsis nevadensis]